MVAGVPDGAVIEASSSPLLLLCAEEGCEDKYAGEKHVPAATQPVQSQSSPRDTQRALTVPRCMSIQCIESLSICMVLSGHAIKYPSNIDDLHRVHELTLRVLVQQ